MAGVVDDYVLSSPTARNVATAVAVAVDAAVAASIRPQNQWVVAEAFLAIDCGAVTSAALRGLGTLAVERPTRARATEEQIGRLRLEGHHGLEQSSLGDLFLVNLG